MNTNIERNFLTIRIPQYMKDDLRSICKATKRTMTRYVVDSVSKNLETDSIKLESQQKRMTAVREYLSAPVT